MKKYIFIPVLNRTDLLESAVKSIKDIGCNIRIIDVSGDGSIYQETHRIASKYGCNVVTKEARTPFNVVQNEARNYAISGEYDYYMFMHNDGEYVDKRHIEKLIDFIEHTDFEKMGAVFTNYDVLCAYNTKAMQKVGMWDSFLQQYFADNDMYYRLELAGYEIIYSGFEVLHNNGNASATIRSDSKLNFVNGITFPLLAQYYFAKWGGKPHEEKFTKPFNSEVI